KATKLQQRGASQTIKWRITGQTIAGRDLQINWIIEPPKVGIDLDINAVVEVNTTAGADLDLDFELELTRPRADLIFDAAVALSTPSSELSIDAPIHTLATADLAFDAGEREAMAGDL